MSLLELPSDSSLEELAQWWAEHFAEIKQLRSFLYQTSRRLTEYVREGGPIRTPSGLLEITPQGWIWDAEKIREAMPALLTGGSVTSASYLCVGRASAATGNNRGESAGGVAATAGHG